MLVESPMAFTPEDVDNVLGLIFFPFRVLHQHTRDFSPFGGLRSNELDDLIRFPP